MVGTAFDVTVTAQDVYGNTVTSYLGAVTFSSSDPYGAGLPPDYTGGGVAIALRSLGRRHCRGGRTTSDRLPLSFGPYIPHGDHIRYGLPSVTTPDTTLLGHPCPPNYPLTP